MKYEISGSCAKSSLFIRWHVMLKRRLQSCKQRLLCQQIYQKTNYLNIFNRYNSFEIIFQVQRTVLLLRIRRILNGWAKTFFRGILPHWGFFYGCKSSAVRSSKDYNFWQKLLSLSSIRNLVSEVFFRYLYCGSCRIWTWCWSAVMLLGLSIELSRKFSSWLILGWLSFVCRDEKVVQESSIVIHVYLFFSISWIAKLASKDMGPSRNAKEFQGQLITSRVSKDLQEQRKIFEENRRTPLYLYSTTFSLSEAFFDFFGTWKTPFVKLIFQSISPQFAVNFHIFVVVAIIFLIWQYYCFWYCFRVLNQFLL